MKKKEKVAIIGTNGLPAKYGGFETLANYLTLNLKNEFEFVVYCSKTPASKRLKHFNEAQLIYIPLKANGWQSILYDAFSLFHSTFKSDVILYLGPGAGFLVPLIRLFKKRTIVNHGGLNEWERTKYSRFQRFVARMGHKYAAKYSFRNITDNLLLKESLKNSFNADSVVIRYGGNHARREKVDSVLLKKYSFLKSNYFVNISRAQEDNNLHLVLEAFRELPQKKLVMVSNWDISQYGIELKKSYKNIYKNIHILDAIYELKEINAIRSNAEAYIHSHSYCGTAPSLVEAMSIGIPIISFDVPTNRETTQNKALYFTSSKELIKTIKTLNYDLIIENGLAMKRIADMEYTWVNIANKYFKLFSES
ncbi:MAG: DUF1972 domain-containing protein [Negativicutes bacterium]|nr:DUF1972 domain-containing protein [Negativicutes bacterium]